MTEDNFEEFLKTKAQGYNAPPARVPRDEMWAAIQARRTAGPRVVYGGGSVSPISTKRFGTRVWLGAAAAAMLLVATGVGIGRWTAAPAPPQVATSTSVPPAIVEPLATQPKSDSNADATEPQASVSSGASISSQTPGTVNRVADAGRRGVEDRVTTPRAPDDRSVGQTPSSQSSAYQLTAVQHLSEAEALLTSFRTRSTADQQMDAQLASWARQLLSNTRLLLDSPVANDPQRRPLLEDLELVLVQIVQLSPGSTPQDRELIEKTLQQDHVMTRLRTAIPAGGQRGS
jgi:hypothetical protein